MANLQESAKKRLGKIMKKDNSDSNRSASSGYPNRISERNSGGANIARNNINPRTGRTNSRSTGAKRYYS